MSTLFSEFPDSTAARLRPGVAASLRRQLNPRDPPVKVALSYGLGVDSSAILLRILREPKIAKSLGIKDFQDFAVVTAMTGHEWQDTRESVEDALLPLLREHGVRYIQVARSAKTAGSTGENIAVLSDTRQPRRLYTEGAYTLYQEMIEGGTIVQTGGDRKCSSRSKGSVLDPVLAAITAPGPWSHLIGFEAEETGRAFKDSGYTTSERVPRYPLIEWGWTRSDAKEYLLDHTGRDFPKSACVFCPFSFGTKKGRDAQIERYRMYPHSGAATLLMEHTALALNERQGLLRGNRAYDFIVGAGLTEVLDQFHAALAQREHALYEVRRFILPGTDSNKWRSVHTVATGTPASMSMLLQTMPGLSDTGPDGFMRRWLLDGTSAALQNAEHFWVVAPVGAVNKQRSSFEERWTALGIDTPDSAGAAALAGLSAPRPDSTQLDIGLFDKLDQPQPAMLTASTQFGSHI